MGFAAGFKVGWDSVSQGMRERERQAMLKGVQAAMDAKPEQSQGYTAQQGAALEAAAARGEKVDVQYKDDGQGNQVFDRYVVTPAAVAATGTTGVGTDAAAPAPQTRDVAMQGVTDFMGERTAGTLSHDQVQGMRGQAAVDAMTRYDPVQGFAMQRQLKQDDRDAQRFGREQGDWKQKDEDRNREVEHRTKRTSWLENSPLGKYQAANAKYEQDTAAYNEGVKAGKSPQELGLPPQKPNLQRPGPLEMLGSYAQGAAIDFEYGKLNMDGLMSIEDKRQALQKENYIKALRVAHSGGTPEQIAKTFNVAGMQIDPKNIKITRTKQANGPDQVMMGYTDEKGEADNINVMAELEGEDKAKQVFDRFYQSEVNRRGNEKLQLDKNTDGRAGAESAAKAPERRLNGMMATLRMDLANADDSTPEGAARSSQIAAKLSAMSTGMRGASAGHDPSDVIKAKKLHAAGQYGSEAEALDAIITKPDKMFQEFQKVAAKDFSSGGATQANKTAEGMMQANGWEKNQSGTWKRIKQTAPTGAPAGAPKTGAEQTIQSGPHKGKTAVWDGQGWALSGGGG